MWALVPLGTGSGHELPDDETILRSGAELTRAFKTQ